MQTTTLAGRSCPGLIHPPWASAAHHVAPGVTPSQHTNSFSCMVARHPSSTPSCPPFGYRSALSRSKSPLARVPHADTSIHLIVRLCHLPQQAVKHPGRRHLHTLISPSSHFDHSRHPSPHGEDRKMPAQPQTMHRNPRPLPHEGTAVFEDPQSSASRHLRTSPSLSVSHHAYASHTRARARRPLQPHMVTLRKSASPASMMVTLRGW